MEATEGTSEAALFEARLEPHTSAVVPNGTRGVWRRKDGCKGSNSRHIVITYPDGVEETAFEAAQRVKGSGFVDEAQALRKKVFATSRRIADEQGVVPRLSWADSWWEALCYFPPGVVADLEERGAVGFVERCRKALRERGRPASRGVIEDMGWIAANVNCEAPDLTAEPSRTALNWVIDCRMDDTIRRQFWSLYLQRFAGRSGSKRMAEAMEESNDDVMRRVFGDRNGDG